jgi:hypothetical protein
VRGATATGGGKSEKKGAAAHRPNECRLVAVKIGDTPGITEAILYYAECERTFDDCFVHCLVVTTSFSSTLRISQSALSWKPQSMSFTRVARAVELLPFHFPQLG